MNLSMEGPPDFARMALERRVECLESDVSALKDTRVLEDRVTQRVTERLQKSSLADKFTPTFPRPVPGGAAYEGSRASPGRYVWLFFDMAADARLMVRMFKDKRYPLAWTTHLVVWLFIPAILTSGWWFPGAWVPFLGPYLDKALDFLLAFCVYKALSRELQRYRDIM